MLAERIRKQFGTPIYIFDEMGLLNRYDEFQSVASAIYEQCIVAVSYKTNPTRALLGQLHQRGAYAEVVSGDELEIAKSLDVPPDQIIFNGPAKTDEALRFAIRSGCFIHCDHEDEIDRIEKIATELDVVAKVGIRLFFPAGESWERFGFEVSEDESNCLATSVIQKIGQSTNLQLAGLHSHIGTNIRNIETFASLGESMAGFAMRVTQRFGVDLEWIDLGGGYASLPPLVSEGQEDLHPLPSVKEYCDSILKPLLPWLQSCDVPPKVFFEPGRTLFNPFGAMLMSVIGRRPADRTGVESFILDAGITSVSFAEKYNLPVRVFRSTTEKKEVRLLGPTCMEHDILKSSIEIPTLVPDDLLMIYSIGCYGMSLAPPFTHFRHGMIGWGEGDELHWLRKPDCVEHSRQLDVIE